MDRRRSKFSDQQILAILRQTEEEASIKELCGRHGISKQTLYRWKKKFDHEAASPSRRAKQLEIENSELKRLLGEKELELRRALTKSHLKRR